jgi:hypothetical protein
MPRGKQIEILLINHVIREKCNEELYSLLKLGPWSTYALSVALVRL